MTWPWFLAALWLIPLTGAVWSGVVETRRRRPTSYWKAPGK